MGASPALLDLPHDAASHVVPGEQLGGAAGVPIPDHVPPPFLRSVGGLVLVERRDVVEHEPPAFAVREDAPFAPDALCDQDALGAGRPHHAGRVELDELHVHEVRPSVVGQGVAVSGALPRIAGDLERPADSAGSQDHGTGREDPERPLVPVVAKAAGAPGAVQEEARHRALAEDFDALVDAVVLEGAQHLETGAVAHVGQAGVGVAAEIALQDAAFAGPVHERAPRLELPNPVGSLLGVKLCHAPIVQVLAAPHRVREVHPPVVPLVNVGQSRGDPSLGHYRVCLAQERLGDHRHGHTVRRGFDGRPESRASGADDHHVVGVALVTNHQKSLQSVKTPMESIRT